MDGKTPPVFAFESRDALAQFVVALAPLIAGGVILGIAFDHGGVRAALATVLATAAVAVGLRSSISVTAGEVKIVRKWFFVPYRAYRGSEIEDVWYGGDWGMPAGAMGVVVKLGGDEVHMGTSRNMHELHDALYKLSAAYRRREQS